MIREVKIGQLGIGGKNPIRIKGMLKTSTGNPEGIIQEAEKLKAEGVEAIRLAVKEKNDAGLVPLIKKHVSLPLAADIHFDYRLALTAIDAGFESIRLNPLNIYKKDEVRQVIRKAKANKVSVRVGINSGGFKQGFSSYKILARQMVKKAQDYIKILEKENFFDIMVSLKGSDVKSTILANRIFRSKFDYPLHLGITATGSLLEGTVKSSWGLGVLLSEGIGEVIRVSLTAPSFWEIRAAKCILQTLDLRKFGPEVISCPTCSRCEVNLIDIVEKFKEKLAIEDFDKPLSIALMGCVVNGPGEANHADIGAAFGRKKAAIFRKGKILSWSNEKSIITDLFKEIKKIWG